MSDVPAASAPSETRASFLFILAAVAAVLFLHACGVPLTVWEYDEGLFALGIEDFNPVVHHPPPPGYPLYMGFAKLLHPLTGPSFVATLHAINLLAILGGMVAFIAAFRSASGELRAAIAGAFLFYVSPAMLMQATVAQSDAGALALLAVAIWLTTRYVRAPGPLSAGLAALACAVAVGWRLQLSIAILPLFFTALVLAKGWRERAIALQMFGVVCGAWLLALIIVSGGIEPYFGTISKQASYFAAHDADLSRSGRSWADIVLRFVAHGWGPKWLSLPILALAAVGFVTAVKSRRRELLPVAVMTAVYFAFALTMMDPADGARYSLPATAGVALAAGLGLLALCRLTRGFVAEWTVLALIAFGAAWYVMPLLRQRVATPSPPYAAAQYIRATAPRDAVILYDLSLRPHADFLLRDFRRMRIDDGLRRFGGRTDVRLFEFVDSRADDGKVFAWNLTDAYGKLTRNHYGVVSVVEIPVTKRFKAVEGLHPPERAPSEGQSWRWIGAKGTIELPPLGASRARVTLRLPKDYPLDSNRVTITPEVGPPADMVLRRGQKSSVTLPVSPAGGRITIVAARSFVPAEMEGTLSRDPRRLSVMFVEVEQLVSAAARASSPASVPPRRAAQPRDRR